MSKSAVKSLTRLCFRECRSLLRSPLWSCWHVCVSENVEVFCEVLDTYVFSENVVLPCKVFDTYAHLRMLKSSATSPMNFLTRLRIRVRLWSCWHVCVSENVEAFCEVLDTSLFQKMSKSPSALLKFLPIFKTLLLSPRTPQSSVEAGWRTGGNI